MKNEQALKTFSDSSFNQNAVTGESLPAPRSSKPRLAPENVQDVNIHLDGSADSKLPQPKRPGQQGAARTSARVDQTSPDSARSAAQEQGLHDPAVSSEQFREMLYRRYSAPYLTAIPFHRWGINE